MSKFKGMGNLSFWKTSGQIASITLVQDSTEQTEVDTLFRVYLNAIAQNVSGFIWLTLLGLNVQSDTASQTFVKS